MSKQAAGPIVCLRCGCRKQKVLDSRGNSAGIVYRRRQCKDCGARTTTFEVSEEHLEKFARERHAHVIAQLRALADSLEAAP